MQGRPLIVVELVEEDLRFEQRIQVDIELHQLAEARLEEGGRGEVVLVLYDVVDQVADGSHLIVGDRDVERSRVGEAALRVTYLDLEDHRATCAEVVLG